MTWLLNYKDYIGQWKDWSESGQIIGRVSEVSLFTKMIRKYSDFFFCLRHGIGVHALSSAKDRDSHRDCPLTTGSSLG